MKSIINSANAPAPIGPYSQAVKANGMIYISGQIALMPGTDQLLLNTIEEETKQVMENLKAILNEAGIGFDHVVKSTIFLSDMQHFGSMNGIYASYFNEAPPARETVHVSGLPKGVNVEISMIAICN